MYICIMSKSKKAKKAKKQATQPAAAKPKVVTDMGNPSFWMQARCHKWMLFVMAIALYANTLTHEYTQDDAIVIYDNMYTQQGLAGIPGILKYDTFRGFFKEEGKSKLVSGGRYRPMTQLMFALEWQIFGKNPTVGHAINILLYALLGVILYTLLSLLLIGANKNGKREDKLRTLIFVTCALFIAHPIHTEAVANIKGRDEIMTLLGAALAFWAALKYYHTKESKWNLLALISFFCALMSKENAITFLAVVPLGFIFFKRQSLINSLKNLGPFIISTVAFLAIRTAVLGADFGAKSMELMNNPFLKLSGNNWVPFSGGEKIATILFTLGKYIGLMVFPHPLCHDYYPRAVEIMSFGDWQVLVSLVLYLAIAGAIFYFWSRDKIIAFGLFFFIATLSIVSNIVFPIGTNMSERFMFMPSLGILLVLARILTKFLKSATAVYGLTAVLVLLLGFKTVTRNTVWKNDFTLFTTDVKTNPRSAKLLNAAGGTLSTNAGKLEAGPQKTKMLNEAIGHLNQAIKIHPTYRNAYLLLGNSHYYLENYDDAVGHLDNVLQMYPDFADAKKNLPIILRDGGKFYGEKKQDFAKSEQLLLRSRSLNPQDTETIRLLGIVNGIKGDLPTALKYFEDVLKMDPNSAITYVSLGTTYQNMGNKEKAREYYDKAVAIDPTALNNLVKQQ